MGCRESWQFGQGDPKKANAAARQVVLSMTSIAIVITISKIFVWVPSFLPSYGLRAADDVRFTMIVISILCIYLEEPL